MHSDSPLVTVIIPAYNAEQYIRRAIESILNQTYSHLEILIADDGSSDDTKDIISIYKDSRIKVLHNLFNSGNIVTSNKLFKAAQGTYITIQDADDWSHPDRILHQINRMKIDGVLACGTQCFNCTESGDIYGQTRYPSDYTSILECTPKKFPVVCATIMIHKDIYRTIGGYEVYFNRLGSADLYWFSKIIDSYKFENVDIPLYYYRRTQHSFSRSIKSERQLVLNDILGYLVNQRRKCGIDAIEREDHDEIESKFDALLSDRHYLSERYREQAVHAVDQGNLGLAFRNINKSLQKRLTNTVAYRTLFYLIRKWICSTNNRKKINIDKDSYSFR